MAFAWLILGDFERFFVWFIDVSELLCLC